MMTLIIIAAVVMCIVAWMNIPWALALVIIGSPTYLLKSTIAGIPVTLLEAMIVGTVVGWTVKKIVAASKDRSILRDIMTRVSTALPRSLWVPLVVVVAGWCIATLYSVDVRASLGALKAWCIEPTLIGFILLVELRDERIKMLMFRAMLAALMWVSLAGIAQMLFFRGTLQDGRLSSVFAPVANYFAMFAAPLIFISIGMVLINKERVFASCAAGAGIIALIPSFSYGGFLAVGAGAIVLFVTLLPRAYRKRALGILIATAVIGFVAFIPSRLFHEKLNFSTRSSSLVRTEIWRTALEIGIQHPVVGIGPNTFEKEYRIIAPTLYHPPLEWLVAKPHNLYLNAWVETGALGIIGLVWFSSVFLVRLFRSHGPDDRMAWIVGAATIAVLAHGLVDSPLFKNDLSLVAAVIVAIGLVSAASSRERQ